MKSKGKIVWLVTWDGTEYDETKRCQIAAVLSPNCKEDGLKKALYLIFAIGLGTTLDDKIDSALSGFGKNLFSTRYHYRYPNYIYGHRPKIYLDCRKVKNLRYEVNKTNECETTVFWTEYPKYAQKALPPDSPVWESLNMDDIFNTVHGEQEKQYTYDAKKFNLHVSLDRY
jgi:hypothetical protein